jgi:hypothetical protein
MPQFAVVTSPHRHCGGSKGALYRETLQATGSYVVRIVIASAEFAPMPPRLPGYPGGQFPTAIGMRFLRHRGIYQSDVGLCKNPNPSWTSPPANIQTRARERAGRIALSPIVLMSSGRLFLDRVARQHCPSPLRRHSQHISIAGSKGTIYHRTVSSVLTGCLTFRDKRIFTRSLRYLNGRTLLSISN